MTDRITIEVDRDTLTGGIQVNIGQTGENGHGHGYRLAGPKYLGASKSLLAHEVTQRDADEIRGYLDAVFPKAPDAPPVVWNFTDDEEWRPAGDPFATRELAQLAAEIDYTNRTDESGTFTWAESTEERDAVDMHLDGTATGWRVWRVKVCAEVDVPMADLTPQQRASLAPARQGADEVHPETESGTVPGSADKQGD
jgi:hypothetical protein